MRKYPSLKAEHGSVDFTNCVAEVIIGLDSHHRGENLGAVDAHVRCCICQHRGFHERSLVLAAREHLRSSFHGFIHPEGRPGSVGFANKWRNISVFFHRVAALELVNSVEQQLRELVVSRPLDPDALYRDARLSAIGEIGVALDDNCRISPELQSYPLLAGLTLQGPTDSGAAGEGQQLDALIAD